MESTLKQLEDIFGKVIDTYSRADMFADGELVDVTDNAKEKGFSIPVAITKGVNYRISQADGVDGRSFKGIMADILWMLYLKIKLTNSRTNILFFDSLVYSPELKKDSLLKLKATVGPGDTKAPVMTIMLQH